MANHSHTAPVQPHSATSSQGHSHGHGVHDVGKEVRKYLIVFGALLVGTLLTVWASYINFDVHLGTHGANIVVALVIAIVKASLVAAFFMHLIDERKVIYGVLGATVFFFIGLMYLTLWSTEPLSFIHLR